MTRGALLLSEYLEANGVRRSAFADRIPCPRPLVTMWLAPDPKKRRTPGRSNAVAIERETGGSVPVSAWDEAAPTVRAAKRRAKLHRIVRRRASRASEHSPQPKV